MTGRRFRRIARSRRGNDLAALRRAGIDFVRLPVDPGPLLAFSGERRERLIGDVLGAVELALAADLAVVLNLHPNAATHHWNPDNLVGSVGAPLFTRYLGLVRDIAARLARLDPARVAFEPLNEPPQGCGAADWTVMQSELLRTARARRAATHAGRDRRLRQHDRRAGGARSGAARRQCRSTRSISTSPMCSAIRARRG